MRETLFKNTLLTLGPLLCLLSFLLMRYLGLEQAVALTLAITLWIALWWVFEPVPIPATSLLPFVLFPVAGVLTHKQAAASLGSHVILLLMGGFILAKGVEKSGLHRRLAYGLLRSTGHRAGPRLVLAFMLSGALLSMWISNTAACLVLLPIALAVIAQLKQAELAPPLILGVAFSCNLGGIATLVGTPPNLIFAGIYESFAGREYSFMSWSKTGLPVLFIGLPLVCLWLTRNLRNGPVVSLPEVTELKSQERRVAMVFGFVVLLWVFRLEPFGGWSQWFSLPLAGDSTVALLGVLLMFVIPAGSPDNSGRTERLLDWETAVDIPWGMLLLFAGGITVATAFQESGTAALLGDALKGVMHFHPVLIVFCICLSITFLTEITSNVATTTLMMPVLAAAGVAADVPIEILMVPAAMSASCAFMLPVATAPNAIAYGTSQVTVTRMIREGFVLNVLMAVVITAVCSVTLLPNA